MLNILLVEDNEVNVKLVEEALKKIKHPVVLESVQDGAEAISFITKKEPYENVFKPQIILLDKNMPNVNGLEFLTFIKKEEVLSKIPVLMFTTSTNPKDFETCYELGVNTYFVKPIKFDQYVELLDRIIGYWSQAQFGH